MKIRIFFHASRCAANRCRRILCCAAVKTAKREKTMPQYQQVRYEAVHGGEEEEEEEEEESIQAGWGLCEW
ncbi:hypothetical protein B0A55_09351 [Friedmanniomyces simplex]|uniref:Uncharacterized protein n=1 Tax=Friedmanniomyces simplex TaxID=329884 RepID=A0A4U0WN50_9PEZI|nr:hypothetical protein B0A55_09351 [Friedmanniomyces simplex]